MKRTSAVKIACIFIAAAIAVFSSSTPIEKVSANSLEELQKKYQELEQKQKAIKEELNNNQEIINSQSAKQAKIKEKIDLTQSQIMILNSRITKTQENIALKEQKINQKEKEIKETYKLFKQRMRAAYMSSDPSMLGILLGAEDLSDFIMRAELVQRVSQHDKALVEKLSKAQKELEKEKAALEADKAELQASKDALMAKQSDLNSAYEKYEGILSDLQNTRQQYLANKAEIERQMEAADKQIQAIIRASQSSGKYTGGKFAWPCPGYTTLSCGYGWRTWGDGSNEFHKGIDISSAGIYGANIVAAADGKVLIAQNYNSNGYGNYVVIDHGGGLSTLYGHASKVIVSAGQTVKRGQVIAKVGSTGWSTGPHLHFEVRKNGVHTDPMPYLK